MERKGVRTDVGDQNREIRSWNKQVDQLEARLAKINGWARYEAAEEKLLHIRGTSTSDPSLMHRLFESAINAPFPSKRKLKHLKDSMGMRNIMYDYNIQDATSYLEACRKIDTEFYQLRHDLKETDEQLGMIGKRMETMEQYNQNKELYRQYLRQPERKKAAFYEANRAGLATFEAADRNLRKWKDSGETISTMKWRACQKILSQKRFILEYDLKAKKDTVHYLEMVKHAFIEDKNRNIELEHKREKAVRKRRSEQAR